MTRKSGRKHYRRAEPWPPDVRDFYAELELDDTASAADIRSAYLKLSKRYHPDMIAPGQNIDAVEFRTMKEAYEVLGDGERKEKYDKGDYQEWIRYRDEVENYENPIDYQRERAYWVEETVERHERKKQKKDEERERLAQREASHRAAVDQWRKEQNWQERVDREQVRQFAMEQEDFLHAEAVALRTASYSLFGGCKCEGCGARRARVMEEERNPEEDLGEDYLEYLHWKDEQVALRRVEQNKVLVDVVGGRAEEMSLDELVEREMGREKRA